MKLAIMQPYFLPYIGYFQLLKAVDKFIVYDNIEFSKKGWIQRNRILLDGKDYLFTLPLKKDSDYLNINERTLAESINKTRDKILRAIDSAYRKAPYYQKVIPVIEECICCEKVNLFDFIYNSLQVLKNYFEIKTEFIISSTVNIGSGLSGCERVIALCKAMKCSQYINAIGGQKLYSKTYFLKHGIDLFFIKTGEFSYQQFGNNYIQNLSIIDLMMFNDREEIINMLNNYNLI